MHSYVYQVSLQPVQSEAYAKAGHLPDWFYEQVCSYAENADPAWLEQAIQELVQFLGPLCTRTGSRRLAQTANQIRNRESAPSPANPFCFGQGYQLGGIFRSAFTGAWRHGS